MPVAATISIDFVMARAHGRYRRRGAADLLIDLVRSGSIRELVRAAGGPGEMDSCADFENWLARDLTFEVVQCARSLEEPGRGYLDWMAMATTVEDLKTRVRFGDTRNAENLLAPHLFHGPAAADDTIAGRRPRNRVGANGNEMDVPELLAVLRNHRPSADEPTSSIRAELELDRAYLAGLLARARRLSGDDQETVLPLIRQEIDLFHLRVAFGLPLEAVEAGETAWRGELHIPGSAISRGAFTALVTAGAQPSSDGPGLRRVIGPSAEYLPAGAVHEGSMARGEIERRAWHRLRQLARRAFRRDPMSLGALTGYFVLRRMAAADHALLAESLRLGLPPAARRARLLQRPIRETRHV